MYRKTTERLWKYHQWHTIPNNMIAYCAYVCGKMIINRVLIIFGVGSQVINKWSGHCDTLWKYWPPLWAKMLVMTSLLSSTNESQQSINYFWYCKSGHQTVIWSFIYIIKPLSDIGGKRVSDKLTAPSWHWVSMERQYFLVLHLG